MEEFRGILRVEGKTAYLEGEGGERYLEGEAIWSGYSRHWINQPVCACRLAQRDYDTGRPLILLWPVPERGDGPFVELYYNERLVKYPASTFGHLAVNVNGEIFNFSHLINENEVMSPEEYFYRPALGEFAPDPVTGRFSTERPGRPYFDKFGRNFMRTIHVLRLEELDAGRLGRYYHRELEIIRNTPPDPARPEKYRDFSFLRRSCTTIIRDGLRECGFSGVSGLLPRDLFVCASAFLLREQRRGVLRVRLYRRPQLMVEEAPRSAITPLLNPLNWLRLSRLPGDYLQLALPFM